MSNIYNKLNLNREMIIQTTEKYCQVNDLEYEIPETFNNLGGTRNRLNMVIAGNCLYLDVHFNSTDGTTTLEDFGGTQQELKKEICAFVKEQCEISNGEQSQWFVIDNISEEDFIATVELIKESKYCGKTIKEEPGKYFYQYSGIYGEKLTIQYYNQRSNKVVIQGRPLLLFLVSLLCQ